MSRRLLAGALCACALTTGPIASAAQSVPRAEPQLQKVQNLADLRADTPIRRAQAELWDRSWGRKLKAGDNVMVIDERLATPSRLCLYETGIASCPPPTRVEALRSRLCRDGVAIHGHVTSERAYLNKSETFLFTAVTVAVDRWIRPDSGRAEIEFSVMGGAVEIGGQRTVTSMGYRRPARPVVMFLGTRERASAAGLVMIDDVLDLPFGAVSTHAAVQELADLTKTCGPGRDALTSYEMMR